MIDQLLGIIGLARTARVDDSGPVQRAQVDQGGIQGGARRLTDNVPVIGIFGFSSFAPIGSEVVLARVGGDRSLSVGIATNHQASRPRDLKPGDSVMYDVRGQRVTMTKDGIEVDAAGLDVVVENCANVRVKATTKVVIDCPAVEMTGTLKVTGIVTAADLAVGDGKFTVLRAAYKAHKHPGVAVGTGTSLTPDQAG